MVEPTHLQQAAPAAPSAWRVTGAAVRGTSHARHDLPCQDAFSYRALEGGGLVIAVADGAGSARYSQYGASSAVDTVLDALQTGMEEFFPTGEEDWQALLWQAFGAARRAVMQQAHARWRRSREYATTLTVAAAYGGWLATGMVGDGVVVVEEAGGRLFAATQAQKGEFANETHFLTERDAHNHLRVQACRCAVNSLAVMSDGLLRLALKLPGGEPHVPFFQPLFRFAAAQVADAEGQLAAFLESERVCARSDDDKTLVLAAYTASRALAVRAPVVEGAADGSAP